jgi:hypothetical protein
MQKATRLGKPKTLSPEKQIHKYSEENIVMIRERTNRMIRDKKNIGG